MKVQLAFVALMAACVAAQKCPTGKTRCQGKCMNFQKDRNNCGLCEFQCNAGEDCVRGKCKLKESTCVDGFRVFNGKCFSINCNTFLSGSQSKIVPALNINDCTRQCSRESDCKYVTFSKSRLECKFVVDVNGPVSWNIYDYAETDPAFNC